MKTYEELFDANGQYITDRRYKEILRLDAMLNERHIPHICQKFMDGWQVVYPEVGEKCVMDAIENYGSYGQEQDKLEIMGLLTPEEKKVDRVLGYLSAEEVCARIERHWREEAIKLNAQNHLGKKYAAGCEGYYQDRIELADAALSSLRPVSREQVEKVWRGCPYCKEDGEGYVQKFGAYSIQNGELTTGHCKPQKIKFCPHCSRPLTDEAVEMVMERLEQIKCKN